MTRDMMQNSTAAACMRGLGEGIRCMRSRRQRSGAATAGTVRSPPRDRRRAAALAAAVSRPLNLSSAPCSGCTISRSRPGRPASDPWLRGDERARRGARPPREAGRDCSREGTAAGRLQGDCTNQERDRAKGSPAPPPPSRRPHLPALPGYLCSSTLLAIIRRPN